MDNTANLSARTAFNALRSSDDNNVFDCQAIGTTDTSRIIAAVAALRASAGIDDRQYVICAAAWLSEGKMPARTQVKQPTRSFRHLLFSPDLLIYVCPNVEFSTKLR